MDKKQSDSSKSCTEGKINVSDKISGTRTVDEINDKHSEDDGEDLPENFFDDFSNQDFMEGLNVVDDWNDDDVEDSIECNEDNSGRTGTAADHTEDRLRRERRDDLHEPNRSKRGREDRKRSHSRNRRSRSRNRPDQKSSYRKSVEENLVKQYLKQDQREKFEIVVDRRRDPEKTKRDIQRDKLRCAKDHEARVFQEQLKIAETGLVPPGTELDVLNSERYKHNEETIKEEIIVKETKLEVKKEKLVEKKKEEPVRQKKSRTPVNRSRRRRPFGRSVSRKRSYSPKRRRKSTHSREREHRHQDVPEVDLRYRIREKRERYMTDRSPLPRRRLSRSPSPFANSPASGISERESWLRSRDRRHSRSLSPVNASRIREVSPKRKKFSFMEEIEIKLRQNQPVRDPNAFNIAPNVPQLMAVSVPKPEYFPSRIPFQTNQPIYMGPPPSMCPPPEPFQPSVMMNADPNIMSPMFIPNPVSVFPHGLSTFSVPQPVPAPSLFIDHNQTSPIQNHMLNVNAGSGAKQENQDLAKLFEDKKISLSDFLSVSAKPIDPSAPVDIHNKIKVISRCQEAIKLLEDPKLTGRFIPWISDQAMELEKRAAENTRATSQSPLRKAVAVRFNFTVPLSKRWSNCKMVDQLSTKMTLHKLQNLLGISEQTDLPSPVPVESSKQQEAVPKPEALMPPPAPQIKSRGKISNSSAQTIAVTCQICEIRNARKLSDGQTQTVESATCDVSTQVSIEDLTKSCTTFIPRGILKTNTSPVKSISHLTPAQLLAQVEVEKKEDMNKPGLKKDTFLAYGRSYSESPIPVQNINPFSDNYLGGDGASSTTGMYTGNPSSAGKYTPDRFGGNMPNASVGYNNVGRGLFWEGGFGSSVNAPWEFNKIPNQGRQFQDSGTSASSGIWTNTGMGRGNNARGFSNTQNNKHYNQHGPN